MGSESGSDLFSQVFQRAVQRGREGPTRREVGGLDGVAVHVGQDTGTESSPGDGEGGAARCVDRNGTHEALLA